MTLKKSALRGFFWTFLDFVFVKGFLFVGLLLLARWMGPAEFGLFGLITVFLSIGTSLTDSGLSASLIRTDNATYKDYSTVFISNVVMSFLIYVLFYFLTPFIAEFYDQPKLVDIIRVYCLLFIISAFSAIQIAILSRELKFKEITIYNIPATVIGVLFGLYLGYTGNGIWSVIFMYIMIQSLYTLILWYKSSWKPKLKFYNEKFKFHFEFGYKLMLSGLLESVFKNVYNIIIGKVYPIQTLAYFERAKKINDYPATSISGILGKVSYPIFSKVKNNPSAIVLIFVKMIKMAFFITAPLMLGLAVVAKPLFSIILGEEWLEAVIFFQILSFASIFYPIHAFNLNILKVYGRSDMFLKLEIYKKIVLVVVVIIAYQFGIIGLVTSSVVTSVIGLLLNTYYTQKVIAYKATTQFLDLAPIFLISIISFFIMHFSLQFLLYFNDCFQILITMFIGIGIYTAINFSYKKSPIYELINLIKKQ